MSGIAKIQQAILALPEADYCRLRQWFSELDWEKWDREIEADSDAGKLDFLTAGALKEKEKDTLRNLIVKFTGKVNDKDFNEHPILHPE